MAPMLGSQRLGIPITSSYEGFHGLALGRPSRTNGVKTVDGQPALHRSPLLSRPYYHRRSCGKSRRRAKRKA